MKSAVAILLTVSHFLLAGTKPEYSVSRIPPGLRNGASAVVREYSEHFEIHNAREATYTVRRIVTIFNNNDRAYGDLVIWYGRNMDIEELEGTLYDEEGNELRELDDPDVKDYAAFSGSLYEDTRIRIATLYHNRYPYTVEYLYEVSFDGFINWPRWQAQRFVDPVEWSRFEVESHRSLDLRYWCNRDTVQPAITVDGNVKRYVWEARNLPKVQDDVVGDVEDITTLVMIAPVEFAIEGFEGRMTSWKEFGKWYAMLSEGRNRLPERVVSEIRGLVNPEDDIPTKVTALYRYMQARTRYVSVQLGIGGWQPFDATYVHERGYGDCKALSNYMNTLLEIAGVKAYPVLINNGFSRFPMITEFTSNQFNHVILCVPGKEDSLWLECTSQSIPVGHIGSGNEDRNALLITPGGGVVVSTPRSPAEKNAQKRTARVKLSLNGDANCLMTTTVSGNQQDRVRQSLHNATGKDQEQWILRDLQIPNVNLTTFSIDGLATKDTSITLKIHLSLPRFATVSGNRMFFRPNLTERITKPPPNVPVRLSPVRLGYAYFDSDSVQYSFPAGFTVEALPEPVLLEASFGRFESKTGVSGDTAIIFTRTLLVHQRLIPAEEYPEYRAFFTGVFKADRSQAVLVRKSAR